MRLKPEAGNPVLLEHFGHVRHAVIDSVCDDGRTLVIHGERYTLRKLTGKFVAEGEHYWGTRARLLDPATDFDLEAARDAQGPWRQWPRGR
jgi:hypothetical protein